MTKKRKILMTIRNTIPFLGGRKLKRKTQQNIVIDVSRSR